MDLATIGLLLAGFALLIAGAEFLVRGATRLAAAAGISPLVIGLTVVAFGTSSPEIGASVAAAVRGQGELAVGNVVGSNIFNVLFILGASALAAPLVVARKLVRIDVPLMIAASVALLGVGLGGRVSRLEGLLLLAGLVAYLVYSIRVARSEPPEAQEQYSAGTARAPVPRGKGIARNVLFVLGGLGALGVGSQWLVQASVTAARAIGVSELIVGLTIVAAGTSLPEGATSVLAALRGERDIAVGNVVGSNLFNILGVLGLSSLVAGDGLPVPPEALRFDVPVMLAAALACLPIFFNYCIERWEGALLFGYYVAYAAFLVLDATDHDSLPAFNWVMLAFVVPLTLVTLAVVTARSVRRARP